MIHARSVIKRRDHSSAGFAEPLDLMIRLTPVSVVARNMSYFKTGPTLASTRKPNA
jgi:hypothetical protein